MPLMNDTNDIMVTVEPHQHNFVYLMFNLKKAKCIYSFTEIYESTFSLTKIHLKRGEFPRTG